MASAIDVAVLMGGPAHEHEVSLESGRVVLEHLIRSRYRPRPVVIDRAGDFHIGDVVAGTPFDLPVDAPAVSPVEGTARLQAEGLDVVYLALHGTGGEDGALQGWLRWNRLPHTGSGVTASVLAMNKCAYKALLADRGLPTAPFTTIVSADWRDRPDRELARALETPGLPAVIKAADNGSSYGVRIARTEEDARAALDACSGMSAMVLWEALVAGRELTCATFGRHDGPVEAWPVVEIVPKKADWFDYESKYAPGGADEICPAPIEPAEAEELSRLAIEIHRLVGCDGLARTDAFLTPEGLVILETNTIPGMTPASLAPKAAAAAGLDFSALLDRMIDDALAHPPRWSDA